MKKKRRNPGFFFLRPGSSFLQRMPTCLAFLTDRHPLPFQSNPVAAYFFSSEA
jgi:hypothetical protein